MPVPPPSPRALSLQRTFPPPPSSFARGASRSRHVASFGAPSPLSFPLPGWRKVFLRFSPLGPGGDAFRVRRVREREGEGAARGHLQGEGGREKMAAGNRPRSPSTPSLRRLGSPTWTPPRARPLPPGLPVCPQPSAAALTRGSLLAPSLRLRLIYLYGAWAFFLCLLETGFYAPTFPEVAIALFLSLGSLFFSLLPPPHLFHLLETLISLVLSPRP